MITLTFFETGNNLTKIFAYLVSITINASFNLFSNASIDDLAELYKCIKR